MAPAIDEQAAEHAREADSLVGFGSSLAADGHPLGGRMIMVASAAVAILLNTRLGAMGNGTATQVECPPPATLVRSAYSTCPVHHARLKQLRVKVRGVQFETPGQAGVEGTSAFLEAAQKGLPLADFEHWVQVSCLDSPPTWSQDFQLDWC